MNDFTFSKTREKKVRNVLTPSKQAIQNILNYSKTMQVKKIANYGSLFFMNN
ncbi:MAG: hypothetical protein LBL13_03000 [Bacteroidales bacterium]|jgi:hypothetical protein|nr:hypothetical protein [Bacteroidales bacterium]